MLCKLLQAFILLISFCDFSIIIYSTLLYKLWLQSSVGLVLKADL